MHGHVAGREHALLPVLLLVFVSGRYDPHEKSYMVRGYATIYWSAVISWPCKVEQSLAPEVLKKNTHTHNSMPCRDN